MYMHLQELASFQYDNGNNFWVLTDNVDRLVPTALLCDGVENSLQHRNCEDIF
jgi:hypothetical protein